MGEDGKTREWKSQSLPAYQRRTKVADALIAGAYLAGTNTRRVRRALKAVFAGEVGKDVVSRTWRKVKGDWDAWNARPLTDEPIIRLILDGTVVRVRLDKKATSISLLVALGVRADGQKVLLAIKNMGGESEAAWRALLDDLVKRGLKTPELVIVDGAPGLEKALAALWSDVLVQRCLVHSIMQLGNASENLNTLRDPTAVPARAHSHSSPDKRVRKGFTCVARPLFERACSSPNCCRDTHSWASDSRQLRAFMDGLRVLSHGITSIIAFDATIGPPESPLAPLLALARFELKSLF